MQVMVAVPRLRVSRHRLGVMAVIALVLLAACSGTKFEYVRSTQTKTAFKVPGGWTVFDKATFLGEAPGAQATTPDPIEWLVAIDGDPSPSVNHVLGGSTADYATDYPQGLAVVLRLTPEDRDAANFAAIRNLIIPIDTIQQELGSDSVQILSYDDRIVRDGFRGIHVVYQVRESALAGAGAAAGTPASDPGFLSSAFVQVNQIGLLANNTDRVHMMAIMCSADCYQRNTSAIESAVNSWTVKP